MQQTLIGCTKARRILSLFSIPKSGRYNKKKVELCRKRGREKNTGKIPAGRQTSVISGKARPGGLFSAKTRRFLLSGQTYVPPIGCFSPGRAASKYRGKSDGRDLRPGLQGAASREPPVKGGGEPTYFALKHRRATFCEYLNKNHEFFAKFQKKTSKMQPDEL